MDFEFLDDWEDVSSRDDLGKSMEPAWPKHCAFPRPKVDGWPAKYMVCSTQFRKWGAAFPTVPKRCDDRVGLIAVLQKLSKRGAPASEVGGR